MTRRILTVLALTSFPLALSVTARASTPPVLESIQVSEDSVSLRLTKPASQRSHRLYDPNRLVINLIGAQVGPSARKIPGKGELIKDIRTAQFSRDPLVARVVVDLARDVEYEASYEDGAWVFRVKDPEPGQEEPAPPAPAPAETSLNPVLEKVELEGDKVLLHLSRPTMQRSSISEDPPRIVIDFQGAELAEGPDSIPGEGSLLKELRWGQFSRDPLVARVVLDLIRACEYSVDWDQGAWVVTLKPGEEPAADGTPEPAAAPPAPEPPNAAGTALSPVLESITVDEDTVALRLSQPSMQRTTVTEDPPRIIVDLQGTQLAEGADSLPGKGKLLKGVRWGQYSREPLIARVVLDLIQLSHHEVTWDQGRWVVRLTGPAEPAAAPAAPAPAASMPQLPATPAAAAPAAAVSPAKAEAAVLEDVLVEKNAVLLKLSRAVSQTASATEAPARIVIDLQGTRLKKGADSLPGEGGLLSEVQWGQFSTEPMVARVILNLSGPAVHKSEWKNGTWRIEVSPADATAEAAVPAAVPEEGTYSGVLKDKNGDPVNGKYEIHLTLSDKESGDELWWEPQVLQLKDGRYSVTLGKVNPLPSPDLPARCAFGAEVMSERLDKPAASMPFLVQLGVFGSEGNAGALKDSLSMTYPGAAASKIPGKSLYRVTVGPFPSREEAEAVVQRLNESGYKAILKKN